jgi:hypothetical protein
LAGLALALDFYTWRKLVREEETDADDAVEMMICLSAGSS